MTALKQLVPAPLTSASLVALWLLLSRAVNVGQLLLAILLALAVPILTSTMRPAKARVRRPLVVACFILRVGYDVLRSNFDVARGVVIWPWRPVQSKFVVIPLDLRDPFGLAALSMVTTVIPGTVWSELAVDRSALLLHVWSVGDVDAYIARFKRRYEKPLREIFE